MKKSPKPSRSSKKNALQWLRCSGSAEEGVPRGWIDPHGVFFPTCEHGQWIVQERCKRDPTWQQSAGAAERPEEQAAHWAYAQGWLSIGHGGVLNAVGHERVWQARRHPAVQALRALLATAPYFFVLRIEMQRGRRSVASGLHEEFFVAEYDLESFLRHGRLRRV